MTNARAFTLLEVTVSITVLAIVAAVLAPTISGLADTYATTQRVGRSTEAAAFAMDRVIRAIREAPESATPGELAIAEAGEGVIRMSDGWEVRLQGGELLEIAPGGDASVLCSQVERFVVIPLAGDGASAATPAAAHTLRVGLTAGGLELWSIGLPRVRMTP